MATLGYGYQSAFAVMEEQSSYGQRASGGGNGQGTPSSSLTGANATRWMWIAKGGDNLEFKRNILESQSITSIGQMYEFNMPAEYDVSGTLTFEVPWEGMPWLWKHLLGQEQIWELEPTDNAGQIFFHRAMMKDSLETITAVVSNGAGGIATSGGTSGTVYGLQFFLFRGTGTGQQFYCTGIKISKAEWSCRPNENLKVTITVAGRAFGTQAITAVNPDPKGYFNFHDLTVYIGESGGLWADTQGSSPNLKYAVGVTEFGLTIDNGLETDRFLVSNKDGSSLYRGEPVRKNKVQVTSKVLLEWDQDYADGSGAYDRLALYFNGTNIKTRYVFDTGYEVPFGTQLGAQQHPYSLSFWTNAVTTHVPVVANQPSAIGQKAASRFKAFPVKVGGEGRIKVPLEIQHYRLADGTCNEIEIHQRCSNMDKWA